MTFPRTLTRTLAALALHAACCLAAQAQAPSWAPPPDSARCPSRWGPADERGSGNLMTRERVLDALKLARTGEVIELSHVIGPQMPLLGTRRFDMHVKRSAAPAGSHHRSSNEELVIAELGQLGTQFDGFAHQSHRGSHYNCFKTDEIATREGFTKLGVHNTGAFIARGVLIDVAGFKGVEMLPERYEVTVADLEGALRRQNMSLKPGDAVMIHTGWGRLYGKDNARFLKSCPGLGVRAAQWLIERDPLLLGADNWPVEVVPNPDPQLSFPVHHLALVVHGVHLLENLKLDELVQKNVHEFAFVMQPLKLQGATGSTVAPIAVR